MAHRMTGVAALASCILLAGCSSDMAIASPAVDDGQWTLVWAEEFAGESIDASRWNVIEDCWGGGNNERQCYTARAENLSVEDGMLVITARQENWSGPAWPAHMAAFQDNPDELADKPFTSGKLTTEGNASWVYGRFEMRARLPQGQGVWPAFWMLPEANDYGGWPLSGEIDILETVNLGVECDSCESGGENSIVGTLHFGDRPPENIYRNREISYPQVLDGEFHTFGVIWEAGLFTWTIDGVPYGTMEASEWWTAASAEAQAPFERHFHIVLNLAIGGNWPENTAAGGVSTDNFPKRMEVDWVRVWQCDADRDTGNGCTVGAN